VDVGVKGGGGVWVWVWVWVTTTAMLNVGDSLMKNTVMYSVLRKNSHVICKQNGYTQNRT